MPKIQFKSTWYSKDEDSVINSQRIHALQVETLRWSRQWSQGHKELLKHPPATPVPATVSHSRSWTSLLNLKQKCLQRLRDALSPWLLFSKSTAGRMETTLNSPKLNSFPSWTQSWLPSQRYLSQPPYPDCLLHWTGAQQNGLAWNSLTPVTWL